MHLVKVQQLETSNMESSRASSMPSIHRATSPVPNPRTQPVPNPRTQVASAGESALARARNYLNSKLDRFDSFLIGCIFVLVLFWASVLAIGFPSFGNFTSQQALMDREDTAVVLGSFLQTLKSTPAFMREEVAVMRQEGDLAMMAENWLAAASHIDAVLQVSSAMRP